MFAFRWRVSLLLLAVVSAACARRGRNATFPLPRPYAYIADTFAAFAFPHDTVASYTWDVMDTLRYVGDPEFYWEVWWNPAVDRHGIDPEGLSLVVTWRGGGPRVGGLREILAGRAVDVDTWCASCTTPAVIAGPDTAVTFTVDGQHLSFLVQGRAGVRRVFPQPPDSVTFVRGDRSGRRTNWTVSVIRPDR